MIRERSSESVSVCLASSHSYCKGKLQSFKIYSSKSRCNVNRYLYAHRLLERGSLSSNDQVVVARMMLDAAEEGEYDAMMYVAVDLAFRRPEESRMMILFHSKEEAVDKALELLRKVVSRVPCSKARKMLKALEERLGIQGSVGATGSLKCRPKTTSNHPPAQSLLDSLSQEITPAFKNLDRMDMSTSVLILLKLLMIFELVAGMRSLLV